MVIKNKERQDNCDGLYVALPALQYTIHVANRCTPWTVTNSITHLRSTGEQSLVPVSHSHRAKCVAVLLLSWWVAKQVRARHQDPHDRRQPTPASGPLTLPCLLSLAMQQSCWLTTVQQISRTVSPHARPSFQPSELLFRPGCLAQHLVFWGEHNSEQLLLFCKQISLFNEYFTCIYHISFNKNSLNWSSTTIKTLIH